MKKTIYYFLFIFILTSLYSCNNFEKFTYTITKSVPIIYNLKINGNFSEERTINESDIKNIFDLPKDSKIEKVIINGVTISMENQPETDAEFLDIVAKLKVKTLTGNTINYGLIKNATIKGVPIGYINVNSLLEKDGLTAIRKFLQEVADPLSTPGQTTATVILNGKSYSLISGGQKLYASLNININAAVTYSVCEYVEFNIFGNSSCD